MQKRTYLVEALVDSNRVEIAPPVSRSHLQRLKRLTMYRAVHSLRQPARGITVGQVCLCKKTKQSLKETHAHISASRKGLCARNENGKMRGKCIILITTKARGG